MGIDKLDFNTIVNVEGEIWLTFLHFLLILYCQTLALI